MDGFKLWRLHIESFIMMDDFDCGITLKRSIQNSKANRKIINLISELLSNKIIWRIREFKYAHDFRTRLNELHEDPSQLEDQVKRNSKSEFESMTKKPTELGVTNNISIVYQNTPFTENIYDNLNISENMHDNSCTSRNK